MPHQRRSDLNSRVKAYRQSAGARITAGCAERFGNWFVYAAAAGSALALSSNASASIVYGTVGETASITTLGGAPGSHSQHKTFNIDGAAFSISVHSMLIPGGFHGNGARLDALSSHAGIELNGSSNLKRVASGNQVLAGNMLFPAAGTTTAIGLFHTANGKPYGTWTASKMGYAGIGIRKNGHTYLGWLQLEYFENRKGAIDKIQAIDYAYNTVAGAPITAGNVPEPSAAALILLAAGAAGIAALRRRRAAKPESVTTE